jgi:hypothetical protein
MWDLKPGSYLVLNLCGLLASLSVKKCNSKRRKRWWKVVFYVSLFAKRAAVSVCN